MRVLVVAVAVLLLATAAHGLAPFDLPSLPEYRSIPVDLAIIYSIRLH